VQDEADDGHLWWWELATKDDKLDCKGSCSEKSFTCQFAKLKEKIYAAFPFLFTYKTKQKAKKDKKIIKSLIVNGRIHFPSSESDLISIFLMQIIADKKAAILMCKLMQHKPSCLFQATKDSPYGMQHLIRDTATVLSPQVDILVAVMSTKGKSITV